MDHGPDDRALLLEKLPLLKVVFPQVDLQIPGKGKGEVLPGALWTAAETLEGLTVGDGVAWCYEPSGLLLASPSSQLSK